MFKRVCVLGLLVLLLDAALVLAARPGLIARYRLNEGSGAAALDSSGNGYDGAILGSPTWTTRPGDSSKALTFGPGKTEGIECPPFDPTDGTGQFTIALWAFWDGQETYHHFFTKSDRWGPDTMMFQLELWGGSISESHSNRIGISYDPDSIPFQTMPKQQWTHLAFVYDGAEMTVYMNGQDDIGPKPVAIGPAVAARTVIGVADNDDRLWTGVLDDIQIYSRPLDGAEVALVMEGDATSVSEPAPRDGAVNVCMDKTLSWKPGLSAVTHDVYFGADFQDVNSATRSDTRDVLVSQGQTANTYEPNVLNYGQTYYWRVDEVNAAPDYTIFRGDIWRFTIEAVALPLEHVIATASHSETGHSPENTVNGSGLNDLDEHSTDPATMWLAVPTADEAVWIQYDLGKARMLHEMWVWNHNTANEPTVGLGVKNAAIEYSLDGQDWTSLGTVEIAQAPGMADYVANTIVPFDSAAARYVRLTVLNGWGNSGQYGLSEVRFLTIPTEARYPDPVDGAEDVAASRTLRWTAGRGAVEHELCLSMDRQAVVDALDPIMVMDPEGEGYTPEALNFGSTYYWKVNEIDDDGQVWEGPVWSFTTHEYAIIDDFERYTDNIQAHETIWQTWIDGIDDQPNNGGSVVGYEISPFAEQTIVHTSGQQSMPLTYENSSFGFSQTYRIWDTPQDWTAGRAETLGLFLRGHPIDFVRRSDGRFIMGATGSGLRGTVDQFRFACRTSSGDGEIIARVDSLAATDDWSEAGIMMRESLQSNGKFAAVAVTPTNGVVFQHRWATSVASTTVQQVGLTAPCWLRLTRSGRNFTASRSADGQNWVPITNNPADSTVEIVMQGSIYVGLALTSGRNDVPTVAEFSEVTNAGQGDWVSKAIGVNMLTNDPEPLYLMIEDADGRSTRLIHEDPNICQAVAWQEWSIPLAQFTDAGLDMTAVKKMTLGLGNPIQPAAGGSGIIYVDDIRVGTSVVKIRSEIPLVNPSFEQPGTQLMLGFEDVPGWNTDLAPLDSGVEPGRSPTDGAWSAYLMAGDPAVWQLTEEVIQSDDVFELTVDAGAACGNPALLMTLYYDDEGHRIPLARSDVKLAGTKNNCSMIFNANDRPQAIGKTIGIAFESTDCWVSLDNVHLYVHDRQATSQM